MLEYQFLVLVPAKGLSCWVSVRFILGFLISLTGEYRRLNHFDLLVIIYCLQLRESSGMEIKYLRLMTVLSHFDYARFPDR